MNEHEQTPQYGSSDGQHPHVPGHDPLGSGMPRQQESRQAPPEASADDAGDASSPADDDSPLGGDENTEDQLTADTAVERDALKSLDPDDTPA